jgi:hypothetical protein
LRGRRPRKLSSPLQIIFGILLATSGSHIELAEFGTDVGVVGECGRLGDPQLIGSLSLMFLGGLLERDVAAGRCDGV